MCLFLDFAVRRRRRRRRVCVVLFFHEHEQRDVPTSDHHASPPKHPDFDPLIHSKQPPFSHLLSHVFRSHRACLVDGIYPALVEVHEEDDVVPEARDTVPA